MRNVAVWVVRWDLQSQAPLAPAENSLHQRPASLHVLLLQDFGLKPCQESSEQEPVPAGPPYTSLQKCFLFLLDVFFALGILATLSLFVCVKVTLPSKFVGSHLKYVSSSLHNELETSSLYMSSQGQSS